MLDVAVEHLPQVERLEEVVGAAAARVLGLDDLPHVAAHGLGDVVDVLGLDGGDEVVLEDAGEVVLELGAAEVGEDLSFFFLEGGGGGFIEGGKARAFSFSRGREGGGGT